VNERIRVLSVIDGLGFGGDETRLLSMSQTLDQTRFAHSVLTLNPSAYGAAGEFQARRQQYLNAGVEVNDLSEAEPEHAWNAGGLPSRLYAKLGILRRARRLARVVRKWNVQLIDAHLESAGVVSVLAGRLSRTPVAITLYGGYSGSDVQWPLPTRVALRLADTVITDSQIRANQMRALLQKQAVKVAVIPNGIPQPRSHRSAEEMRRMFGLPDSRRVRVIGQVGRLIEYKGHEVLLHTARKVIQQEPDTAFLVVGYTRNPAYKDYLRRLSANLGIADRVVITEYQADIADVWNAIDVHAHASLFDSLPISIAEGMSLAKPAAVTAVGGIPEIVLHGRTGLIVSPGDPDALADALLSLVRQPDLASRLGRCARERYEELYCPEIMAKALESQFASMLDPNKSRSFL